MIPRAVLTLVVAILVSNLIIRFFSKKGGNQSPKGNGNGGGKVIRPFPQVAPTPHDDPADKLQKLKELHDSGVLTDEEFAEAKSKVLKDM
jgi:hypothetical protein